MDGIESCIKPKRTPLTQQKLRSILQSVFSEEMSLLINVCHVPSYLLSVDHKFNWVDFSYNLK